MVILLSQAFGIEFEDCYFRKIIISNGSRAIFKNCHISMLDVDENSCSNVIFQNSWIYLFLINQKSFSSLKFLGGGILGLECPNPSSVNPFVGSVVFSDVKLAINSQLYPIEGAQPYRNMRFHLNSLQNGPAAAVFHSAEQGIERETETLPNRFFSWLYSIFSDYGASPGLPLAWLAVVWLFTAFLLLITGTVAGGQEHAVGWLTVLFEEGCWSKFLRAAILGAQPLSWIGGLVSSGAKGIVIAPVHWWMQAWLVIDGILSGVLLALFIFALRRRFKMM